MLIKRVWIDPETADAVGTDATSADVLVEMEDGQLWQAQFVTLDHLRQEMVLSLDVARDLNRALAPRQFLALETPHVIVEAIDVEAIEDVVDNLMALGVFETVFALFKVEPESGPVELPAIPHAPQVAAVQVRSRRSD